LLLFQVFIFLVLKLEDKEHTGNEMYAQKSKKRDAFCHSLKFTRK